MPPHFFRRNGTGHADSPARRGAIPLRSPHGAATRRAESHGRAQPPRPAHARTAPRDTAVAATRGCRHPAAPARMAARDARACAQTPETLRKDRHTLAQKRKLSCARTPAPLRINTNGNGQRQKRPQESRENIRTMTRTNGDKKEKGDGEKKSHSFSQEKVTL